MKTNLMQLLRLVLMVLAVAWCHLCHRIHGARHRRVVLGCAARYRVRGPALYVPPDAAPRGPGKSRAAAARKEAQPPFETLIGAVTGGCRSFCRFRVRDPAGIVFRGPQVPCGSFVRDRSSGRLDVDPGSERRSESSVLSDQPPPACAGRRTRLSGGRRMFSSESRRAFRFRNKGSCLFRRPIVRVRPNCPTWC